MMSKKSLLVKKFRKMSEILRMTKNLQNAELLIESLFHMKSGIRQMMVVQTNMKKSLQIVNLKSSLLGRLNSRLVSFLLNKRRQSCIRLKESLIASQIVQMKKSAMNKKSLIAPMRDLVDRLWLLPLARTAWQKKGRLL